MGVPVNRWLGFGSALLLLGGCESVTSPFTQYFIADSAVVNDKNESENVIKGGDAPKPIYLDTYCFFEDRFKETSSAPKPKASSEAKPKSSSETQSEAPTSTPSEPSPGTPPKTSSEPQSKPAATTDVKDVTSCMPAYAKALKTEKESSKAAEAKILRNRLQLAVLSRSNDICNFHKGAILANAASFSFFTGMTATVLSGVSAIVGVESAKTALSTASALTNATGTAIKAEFYQNLFGAAIVKEIEKLRGESLTAIDSKRTKPVSDYSVDESLDDAKKYHALCSFYRGVVSLTEDKKETPLTWDEADQRIKKLETENVTLEKTINETKNASRKASAQVQLNLNLAEIQRLMIVRQESKSAMIDSKKGNTEPPDPKPTEDKKEESKKEEVKKDNAAGGQN